jgi:hypothetical protein
MIKQLQAFVALASVSTVAFAQGTVNFSTSLLGSNARVTKADGTFAGGSAFLAQLYAAPGTAAESALVAVGASVNFRSGVTAGYVQTSGTTSLGTTVDPVVIISAAAAGGPVTVQLRAWDAAYATYEAASSANGECGKSALLSLAVTGNPNGSPPTIPVDLIGLQGFKMAVVPEPTALALVLLGGAALLIRRHKQSL